MTPPAPAATGAPLRILLVEDNDAHTKLILRAFREDRLANPIDCVQDGEQALDFLFRRGPYADPASSPRPDLILLDLKLPKVDGIEVLKQVKADPVLRVIPVVVLTSSNADNDLRECYANFANSFLSKPVDFEKFHKMVQELDLYWTVWNRPPRA
ncbi:MAG TPA: response regulator [Acidiferrobacterales bacterium]|jgi:CheY-like chemotaxis protein